MMFNREGFYLITGFKFGGWHPDVYKEKLMMIDETPFTRVVLKNLFKII